LSEPDVVIGHDHITGLVGHHIARRIYGVPYIHFVHTLPEEIEKYKTRNFGSLLRGGVKSGIQTQQCKLAQLVVAVGPRIYADFCNRLGWAGTRVVEIQPGLSQKLATHKADLSKPRRSDCLLVARLEDPVLKGAPLACQVITQLNSAWSWQPASKRPKLILRGFTHESFEAELDAIDGMEAAQEFVHCRPYTTEEDDIAGDICAASVVIMPSKQEGFGLTALEAIAAGIPIVITSESGLGEFLLKLPTVNVIAQKCVADVIGESDAIMKDWAGRIAGIFSEPNAAFEDAQKLRTALLPILTWERAARSLSNEIELLLNP
jgi:glycosyltransferase involved in cell wall biosynthesis